MHSAPSRLIGAFLAALLLLAACGGDDDEASSATTAGGGDTSAAPASTTASTATTAAGGASMTAAAGGIVAGTDAEVDKVVAAYGAVFDSAVPFDAKSAYLADADTLRPVVEAYAAAGGRFGDIKLVPTAVTINGDQAAVTYDVLFGTATQYRGLKGTAVRRGDTWTVTRDEFCSFMASARTPCPTS